MRFCSNLLAEEQYLQDKAQSGNQQHDYIMEHGNWLKEATPLFYE